MLVVETDLVRLDIAGVKVLRLRESVTICTTSGETRGLQG